MLALNVNSLTLEDVVAILQVFYSNSFHKLIPWTLPVKLVSDESHRNLLMAKSTLIQVMAWCCQAKSHYLSQCWCRSLSSYGIARTQWVKLRKHWSIFVFSIISQNWDGIDSWNPSSWMKSTALFYVINTKTADDLFLAPKALAAMVYFFSCTFQSQQQKF